MQRSRVLAAAVGAIAEHGYADASVAAISSRAGVSRRTFYELFDNREQCLLAILREIEARLEHELAVLGTVGEWRERIRAGLWAILCLFDREPALARVCLLESQRAGANALAERERILARLVRVVDQGRTGNGTVDGEGAVDGDGEDGGGPAARRRPGREQVARPQAVSSLTAEALVGAVIAVLQARLARSGTGANAVASVTEVAASHRVAESPGAVQPLSAMLGELTGLIVLPYQGPAVARRERLRKAPDVPGRSVVSGESVASGDPFAGLAMRFTYRTARVLEAVDALERDAGVGPSNRAIAERAGVRDAGQISKLLSRLGRLGLLVNAAPADGHARGEANRWELTPAGRRLLEVIGAGESSEGSDAEWLSRAIPVRRTES